ncbi:MAG TPA: ROK family protein [Bryobacteraceae bacterium]|nr:ROK family protein [Bryobacteraceae bacterium]
MPRLWMEVTLDDRSRAIAIGERRAIREDCKHPDALYVNVGTGVGLGIFVGGQLYRGQAHAGEVGHLTLDKNGPLCACGKKGCVEAYAAIPAVIRGVRGALAAGTASLIRDISLQYPGAATIEMVVAAAGKGDRVALSALQQAATGLGLGIAHAVLLLNPSLVALRGRLARIAGRHLVPAIRQTVRQQCSELTHGHFEIRLASAKKDVAAVGCALLAAEAEAAILVRESLYEATKS